MEIKIVTVVKDPSDVLILDYAKKVRELVGPKSFIPFLRGEEVTYSYLAHDGLYRTTYQLSGPAEGILIEKAKK